MKGPELRALLHITFAMLASAGFGDFRPAVITYNTNALMTIDEVITEVLNSHIQLPTGDMMDGEKTGFEVFRTHVPQVIRELAILEKLRPWYVDHFRRYIGDLVYKLDMGETQASSLDQFDLTLLTAYATEDSEHAKSQIDGFKPFKLVPARDSDPETAEVIGRIKSVVEPGPFIRFHRLLSNADRNELAYIIGPIVNNLSLVSGYRIDRGPFYEQYLNVTESITWGDAEAFKSEMSRLQFLDNKDPAQLNLTGIRVPVKKELWKGIGQGTELTPILLDYKPSISVQIYRSDTNSLEIAHEWRSVSQRKLVSTRTGATTDTMLLDMAHKMTSLGEVATAHSTIDSFSFVDLDDTVEARKIEIETSDVQSTGKNIITEMIYYVSGGAFQEAKEIDMTLFYNRMGYLLYRPAFSEYFKPTLEWFRTPDTNAVDYIIAQLGLSPMDATRSKDMILISHNAEKFKRICNATDDRLSDVINLKEHCMFVGGFTPPRKS